MTLGKVTPSKYFINNIQLENLTFLFNLVFLFYFTLKFFEKIVKFGKLSEILKYMYTYYCLI